MIRKLSLAISLLLLPAGAVHAQSSSESLQIHGFATQGFLFSSHNNFVERHASVGDPGWTDAVISFTDTPLPKLRVGVQVHYSRLGDVSGDTPLIVDWALGDYQVNNYFGVRAGKVKTPIGLFNDSQDIDAVLLWSLLPQSMYPIDNRSFFLSHLGGESSTAILAAAQSGASSVIAAMRARTSWRNRAGS